MEGWRERPATMSREEVANALESQARRITGLETEAAKSDRPTPGGAGSVHVLSRAMRRIAELEAKDVEAGSIEVDLRLELEARIEELETSRSSMVSARDLTIQTQAHEIAAKDERIAYLEAGLKTRDDIYGAAADADGRIWKQKLAAKDEALRLEVAKRAALVVAVSRATDERPYEADFAGQALGSAIDPAARALLAELDALRAVAEAARVVESTIWDASTPRSSRQKPAHTTMRPMRQ